MLASSYPALAVLALYVAAMLAHVASPVLRAYRERVHVKAYLNANVRSASWLETRTHIMRRKVRVMLR